MSQDWVVPGRTRMWSCPGTVQASSGRLLGDRFGILARPSRVGPELAEEYLKKVSF